MSTGPAAYTASELLAVMSARLLRDGQVVFAGVGIPLLAATLAQRLHAPGLTVLFEGGVIGAFIAGWLLPRLGVHIAVGSPIISQIISAFIGALILLFILGLVRR